MSLIITDEKGAVNLKEDEEGCMRGLGGKGGKGEMQLKCNLKNKQQQQQHRIYVSPKSVVER